MCYIYQIFDDFASCITLMRKNIAFVIKLKSMPITCE